MSQWDEGKKKGIYIFFFLKGGVIKRKKKKNNFGEKREVKIKVKLNGKP